MGLNPRTSPSASRSGNRRSAQDDPNAYFLKAIILPDGRKCP
jgi:hypothetical protein